MELSRLWQRLSGKKERQRHGWKKPFCCKIIRLSVCAVSYVLLSIDLVNTIQCFFYDSNEDRLHSICGIFLRSVNADMEQGVARLGTKSQSCILRTLFINFTGMWRVMRKIWLALRGWPLLNGHSSLNTSVTGWASKGSYFYMFCELQPKFGFHFWLAIKLNVALTYCRAVCFCWQWGKESQESERAAGQNQARERRKENWNQTERWNDCPPQGSTARDEGQNSNGRKVCEESMWRQRRTDAEEMSIDRESNTKWDWGIIFCWLATQTFLLVLYVFSW